VNAPRRVILKRKERDLPEPKVQDARRRRHRRGTLQEKARWAITAPSSRSTLPRPRSSRSWCTAKS